MGKTLQTPPSGAPANQQRASDTKERKSSLIYVNCNEGNLPTRSRDPTL
jgi:hypothetical protein